MVAGRQAVAGTGVAAMTGTGTVAEPGPVAVVGRQTRQDSPGTPSPPTQPVTKFAQQPAFSCSPVTKFAQQPQKHQIWGVSSAQGELFHAPDAATCDVETNNTTATK